MTEETLRCPFCEEELYYFLNAILYSCENPKCIIFDQQINLTQFDKYEITIQKLKEKSFSEGYQIGKHDELKRINISELKSSILEEISDMDLSIYSSMRSAHSAIVKLTIHRTIKELEK